MPNILFTWAFYFYFIYYFYFYFSYLQLLLLLTGQLLLLLTGQLLLLLLQLVYFTLPFTFTCLEPVTLLNQHQHHHSLSPSKLPIDIYIWTHQQLHIEFCIFLLAILIFSCTWGYYLPYVTIITYLRAQKLVKTPTHDVKVCENTAMSGENTGVRIF